ncbi:MAG: hypothetical protein ABI183_24205 [Polyangiaceae bacterium]
MNLKNSLVGLILAAFAIVVATACAKGSGTDTAAAANGNGAGGDSGTLADGAVACPTCDDDGDGVKNGTDQCPDTPNGAKVNAVGCADTQLTPKLEVTFPSYGLTWTPTGDLGRPGGLTWMYSGINRADLFHIYWILCDEPSLPCGLSLDGPLKPFETWQFSAADSDLPNGKIVLTNTTQVLLDDASMPSLNGRLTVTITDANDKAIPFATIATLGVPARSGKYGVEITGASFKIVALAEVQDPSTSTWTPYLDYYDAQGTPDTGDAGGNATVSYGGSFYDK